MKWIIAIFFIVNVFIVIADGQYDYHDTQDSSVEPTIYPTCDPTVFPTTDPSTEPTYDPTPSPSISPTTSFSPSIIPTPLPTLIPSIHPTPIPSLRPTSKPSTVPTTLPTNAAGISNGGDNSGALVGPLFGILFGIFALSAGLYLYYRHKLNKPSRFRQIGGYSSEHIDDFGDRSGERSRPASFSSTASTTTTNPVRSGSSVEMTAADSKKKIEVKLRPFNKSNPTASLLGGEENFADFDPFNVKAATTQPPSLPPTAPPRIPRLPPPGSGRSTGAPQSNDSQVFHPFK